MSELAVEQNLILEAKLNFMAAAPLAETLTALQNTPVKLDGSNVNHIDMPCVQILLAAARHWHGTNVPFALVNLSDAFQSGLATLGLDPSIFQDQETT